MIDMEFSALEMLEGKVAQDVVPMGTFFVA